MILKWFVFFIKQVNGYVVMALTSSYSFNPSHILGHQDDATQVFMSQLTKEEFHCQIRLLQLFGAIPENLDVNMTDYLMYLIGGNFRELRKLIRIWKSHPNVTTKDEFDEKILLEYKLTLESVLRGRFEDKLASKKIPMDEIYALMDIKRSGRSERDMRNFYCACGLIVRSSNFKYWKPATNSTAIAIRHFLDKYVTNDIRFGKVKSDWKSDKSTTRGEAFESMIFNSVKDIVEKMKTKMTVNINAKDANGEIVRKLEMEIDQVVDLGVEDVKNVFDKPHKMRSNTLYHMPSWFPAIDFFYKDTTGLCLFIQVYLQPYKTQKGVENLWTKSVGSELATPLNMNKSDNIWPVLRKISAIDENITEEKLSEEGLPKNVYYVYISYDEKPTSREYKHRSDVIVLGRDDLLKGENSFLAGAYLTLAKEPHSFT